MPLVHDCVSLTTIWELLNREDFNSAPALCTHKDQKPITVGTDPVVLSVGCFQNTGSYKRALAPDDPYEPLQRKYGVRSEIDGGWSC